MAKELVISATSHERRVAILEEGQLVEIYIEREKEFALVGSIYKGKVTRVLPGMQSAFVDIGLDGDAFLYVSDVFENMDTWKSTGAKRPTFPLTCSRVRRWHGPANRAAAGVSVRKLITRNADAWKALRWRSTVPTKKHTLRKARSTKNITM